MRRTILGGILAASLSLPALALAAPATGQNTATQSQPQPNEAVRDAPVERDRSVRPHDQPANGTGASIGAGMDAGNDPGHVTGPGNAPVDNSARGPLNDVTPGRGSADTHQSKKPRPVR